MSLCERLAAVFVIAALAGCGFQMRGAATIPAEMDRTYIATSDRRSVFYRKLRAELMHHGIELVDSPVDATATFSIHSDLTGQRVLSVSARNVPREYEIFYTVLYSLQSGEETLLEPRSQSLTMAYQWDETEVLGKEKEEEILRDSIADDLVRVVMMQISSL